MSRSTHGATLRLLAAALACLGAGCSTPPESPEFLESLARPSILLISLDTTRADRLGCYGHPGAKTPNLDRWAREGWLFENAASPAPITLPAHASLMTGMLPPRHGVRDNGLYRLPDTSTTLAEVLAGHGYDTAAVVAAAVMDRQYGLNAGFASYDDRVASVGTLAVPERSATEVTTAALESARALKPPFLLFVHYFDPHADYRPPQPFAGEFRSDPYDGEIAYMDHELGRLRDGLEELGLLADTVVAVVADHGESLGEHGEPTHGVMLYRSTIRIPMILSAPGRLKAGERREEFARLTDVMPTLLDLAGVDVPPGLDGRSLTAPAEDERWLLLESDLGYNSYGWSPLRGITNGSLKWIAAPREELYDLEADPFEKDNLIDGRAVEARRLAGRWREAFGEERYAPPPGDGSSDDARERLAQLESLGYVSSTGRPAGSAAALADPKDVIGTLGEINQARKLMSAGRGTEALSILTSVTERSPRNLSALVLLGSAYIEVGRPRSAIVPLTQAVTLAPHHADVHFNLGIAHSMSGNGDGAVAAWQRALEVSPRYMEAAANLIDLLQTAGRSPEARQVLNQARENGIEGPVIDYLYGRLALELGEHAAAAQALTRALGAGLPPGMEQDARALLSQTRR